MARKSADATSTGEVVLTGNADKLDSALVSTEKRLTLVTQKISAMAAEQDKSQASLTRFDAAVSRANAGMGKATTVTGGLTSTYNRLGFAAHQLVAGTANFNQALQGVLGTLGPYGVAAGAAVGVVLHLANAHSEAAEAAKKQATETRKAKQAAEELAATKRLEARNARFEADVAIEKDNRDFLAKREFDDRRRELEVDIAAADAFRQNASDLRKDLAELQAAEVERTEGFAAGQEFRHQEELRQIAETGKAEETHHKAAKAANDESYALARRAYELEQERGRSRMKLHEDLKAIEANNARDREDFFATDELRFEQAIKRAEQLDQQRHRAELGRIRAANDAGGIKDPVLAGLEGERIDAQFQFASAAEEFDQEAEQARQIRHENELARIEIEKRAREEQLAQQGKLLAAGQQYAQQAVLGLLSISDARRQAKNAALAQGKTEAEAAKAGKVAELQARSSAMQGIRNMAAVKAIEQTALGIAALASFNFPGAALHFASAATFGILAGAAGVRSNTLAGQASGMGGSGGGFGGGGSFGPGAGGAANGSGGGGGSSSMPPGSNSPIPGSPGPGTPRVAAFTGNNFAGATFHLYGAGGRKEFIRELDQDLYQHRHDRPRRSA